MSNGTKVYEIAITGIKDINLRVGIFNVTEINKIKSYELLFDSECKDLSDAFYKVAMYFADKTNKIKMNFTIGV